MNIFLIQSIPVPTNHLKHSWDLRLIIANIPPAFSIVLMSDNVQHKSQTCGRFFPWDDEVRIHKTLLFVTWVHAGNKNQKCNLCLPGPFARQRCLWLSRCPTIFLIALVLRDAFASFAFQLPLLFPSPPFESKLWIVRFRFQCLSSWGCGSRG